MVMPQEPFTEPNNKSTRRYDLDWLRIFAVLLLIYFHTAAIFSQAHPEFYVKNDVTSRSMGFLISFIHQWHMPLFFLLSGSATWFALGFRTGKQYATERFKRLLIPCIFGILVIVPPQVYYWRLSDSNYQGTYLQFYPRFFQGIRPEGNFEWAHLWFIVYLFVFSLLALPLFLYLRQDGQRQLSNFVTFAEGYGAIFLMAVPLAVIEGVLRPRWPGFQNLYDDWANFCLYLTYFVYGYLICADARVGRAIARQRYLASGLAIASMSVLFGLWITENVPEPGYSVVYITYQCYRGFNSWFWVVALLGWGQRYLNFNSRWLQYFNQAAYPFYILHQTVIVAIAFYIVQWNMDWITKFWIISTVSLVITILLYDLVVKRTNLTRFLFGLKSLT